MQIFFLATTKLPFWPVEKTFYNQAAKPAANTLLLAQAWLCVGGEQTARDSASLREAVTFLGDIPAFRRGKYRRSDK